MIIDERFLLTGEMQPRQATLQILPSSTTSQRSTSNQRAKPSSIEKCPHTASWPYKSTHGPKPDTFYGNLLAKIHDIFPPL